MQTRSRTRGADPPATRRAAAPAPAAAAQDSDSPLSDASSASLSEFDGDDSDHEAAASKKKKPATKKKAPAKKTAAKPTAAAAAKKAPAKTKRKRAASPVPAAAAADADESGCESCREAPAPKPASKRQRKTKAEAAAELDPAMLPPRMVHAAKRIGAHISAAGGPENAIPNALKIGADAMSFFLKSSRTWASKPLSDASIKAFKANCEKHGYDPAASMIPHGSYLCNLGNPDAEKREKSYQFVLDELKRCEALGIKLYNFHPGSTVGECTEAECIAHIADNINRALRETSTVVAVIENTAGQGNVVGYSFEHLRDIIALVEDKSRVAVCLDTCHLFAAGYDIRDRESFTKTFADFDRIVGNKYLVAFHVNDSLGGLNSRKDRHAPLGKGLIGHAPFEWLMQEPAFDDKLFILETPEENLWVDEVKLLRSYFPDTAAAADESLAIKEEEAK
ncbi:DNA-(apurinic or apyrimidinic site) lyase [Blastocladiella emersonii ATCC 22665]|nr:DNA-(apurinic or apyrimidinic site) lyase [Blastocladiella emersonii ATCC 22665]